MLALDLAVLDLSERHLHMLQTLLSQYTPQAQVWAYGSRVRGQSHEGSDLDLVLRHRADLSLDVHMWSRMPEAFHANIEAAYVVLQP